MIVCVDVDYRATEIVTACVGIRGWTDSAPAFERVWRVKGAAAPYESGRFYVREMPHIAAALASLDNVSVVVIDGYVWLAKGRAGLGAHLHTHLSGRYPIVGVAKKSFAKNDVATLVLRGRSAKPLYVTAVGVSASEAAKNVARMHGDHRLPTMLKRVDRLARDA